MKIFFVTFFIAELIIVMAIILKICQFDKCVNNWNKLVLRNQAKISVGLVDFRLLLEEFTKNLFEISQVILKKRREYTFKFLKTSVIYGSLFFLKGKYKKSLLAYQMVKEVYEGIKESENEM
ncbi:MAG: hypothetical protein WCY19_01970 [Candidatus Gastranaerophilaceae bacterium]